MDLSTRKGRRRPRTTLSPACESLEGRQLLSDAAPVLPATTLIPPAAEVANAEAVLTSKAAQTFPWFVRALSRIEHDSTVTLARFTALVQDKAAIDAAIESSNLSAVQKQDTINLAEDHIDATFTDSNQRQLDGELTAALSGVSVLPRVLHRTFHEMRVIGHAARARVPIDAEQVEQEDQSFVASSLGPSPDTDIWPGSLRDPLVVYYNGQVGNFVR